MGEFTVERAIVSINSRLGNEIVTESELAYAFLSEVVLPFLRSRIGLLAEATLERTIVRGRYDARVGSLLFEFEKPFRGLDEGIKQAKQYITEYNARGELVKCFVTDGDLAVIVNEAGNVGDLKKLIDIIYDFKAQLAILALKPVEPRDLLRVLGPKSDISRAYLRELLEIFNNNKNLPIVSECFDLWMDVYGAAANLSRDVIKAVKRYARGIDINLKSKRDVESFLFVVETYLSILMKLLLAAIAVKRQIIIAPI